MGEPAKNASFLGELSRRRVIRSAIAYVVVSWGLVEACSVVLPEFGAPAWAMRAVILALVVGFPPAMLLAWTVDLSPGGIVRTPDSGYLNAQAKWPRLVTLLMATAMSAAVLWLVWDDYILQSGRGPLRTTIKSEPVIAVNSPRQRLGPVENAWLGDGIANLVQSQIMDRSRQCDDILFDHQTAHVVRPEEHCQLSDLEALRDPTGLDVREVVEKQSCHG